jgi:regulator of protease activity HflC (stomatin/prohibitin superfamily)
MRVLLDEATDPWGIKVHRVEVRNIIPPRDIQEAMEKQMRAERERREAILRAEGEKRAQILTAEGEKESMILRAEAKKEALITEAEGEAQAIERVYQAQAKGIALINNAKPSEAFIALKGLESLEKVADGQATKIIVPTDLQNVATTLTTARELLFNNDTDVKPVITEAVK